MEYYAVDTRMEHGNDSIPDSIKYTLLFSNLTELLLEMFLYAWLIHVSYVLGGFLRSFDETFGEQFPDF